MNIALKFLNIRSLIGRLSLQHKILFLFVGASILILFSTVYYIGTKAKTNAISNAYAQMGIAADKQAAMVQSLLEKDYGITKTLSGAIQNHRAIPQEQILPFYTEIYKNVLVQNPDIIAIWDSWEFKYLDSTYQKDYGRYKNVVWREESGSITSKLEKASLNGDPDTYKALKTLQKVSLEEPYFDAYNNTGQILMTSIIEPNMVNGKLAGFVGVDIPLTHYYELFKQIKPYKDSYALLLSNAFKYIAHPKKDMIGENALTDYENILLRNGVLDRITNGDPVFFEDTDINGIESYFTIRPVTLEHKKNTWAMVIVVPKSVIVSESNSAFWKAIIVGIIGVILLSAFILYASRRYIINPIASVVNTLSKLSKGHISTDMIASDQKQDEIGTMVNHLSNTVKGLTQKLKFAEEIGEGNYNAQLELLSNDDVLGKSLIEMGNNLRTAQEEDQKRKIEDQKRQWINEGLAKFGDILRQNNDRIDMLSANILKNLIEYLNATQGGLFILNNDDIHNQYFDQLAAYAYNRQKFTTKQVMLGEGLVGNCALEKKTIHLANIPENYITISSGLGEAKPRNLLIVPLKIEEDVLGVVELASFKDFEDYQISFIETVAQSIAQTLTSVRNNIRTTELLERTQQQAEEMKAQEEEVRQNLEELATIKEELEKRNEEFIENQKTLEWEKTLLDALLSHLPDRIYFKDLQSKFIKASQSTIRFFGLSEEEDLYGKSDFDFFGDEHAKPAYDDEQRIIKTSTPIIGIIEKEVRPDGSATWAETSKLPLKTPNGEIIGTFGITKNITSSKQLEEEVNKQAEVAASIQKDLQEKSQEMDSLYEAISNSSFIIEYNPEGYITNINKAYTDLMGVKYDEVIGKHHSFQMEFTEEQRKNYKAFWEDLNNGVTKKETHKFTVNDKSFLFFETYNPIKDQNGKVFKILKIGVNISHLLTEESA